MDHTNLHVNLNSAFKYKTFPSFCRNERGRRLLYSLEVECSALRLFTSSFIVEFLFLPDVFMSSFHKNGGKSSAQSQVTRLFPVQVESFTTDGDKITRLLKLQQLTRRLNG